MPTKRFVVFESETYCRRCKPFTILALGVSFNRLNVGINRRPAAHTASPEEPVETRLSGIHHTVAI